MPASARRQEFHTQSLLHSKPALSISIHNSKTSKHSPTKDDKRLAASSDSKIVNTQSKAKGEIRAHDASTTESLSKAERSGEILLKVKERCRQAGTPLTPAKTTAKPDYLSRWLYARQAGTFQRTKDQHLSSSPHHLIEDEILSYVARSIKRGQSQKAIKWDLERQKRMAAMTTLQRPKVDSVEQYDDGSSVTSASSSGRFCSYQISISSATTNGSIRFINSPNGATNLSARTSSAGSVRLSHSANSRIASIGNISRPVSRVGARHATSIVTSSQSSQLSLFSASNAPTQKPYVRPNNAHPPLVEKKKGSQQDSLMLHGGSAFRTERTVEMIEKPEPTRLFYTNLITLTNNMNEEYAREPSLVDLGQRSSLNENANISFRQQMMENSNSSNEVATAAKTPVEPSSVASSESGRSTTSRARIDIGMSRLSINDLLLRTTKSVIKHGKIYQHGSPVNTYPQHHGAPANVRLDASSNRKITFDLATNTRDADHLLKIKNAHRLDLNLGGLDIKKVPMVVPLSARPRSTATPKLRRPSSAAVSVAVEEEILDIEYDLLPSRTDFDDDFDDEFQVEYI